MEIMVIGFIITLYLVIFHKHHIRIELDKVSKFLAFMAIATAVRIAIKSYLKAPAMPDDFPVEFYQLALVFWEDALFMTPLYFTYNFLEHKRLKYVWIAMAIASSTYFALGHAYQGLVGILVTSIYPVFISLKYSRKVGIGTVMVCHVLYDMITYATLKLGHLLY